MLQTDVQHGTLRPSDSALENDAHFIEMPSLTWGTAMTLDLGLILGVICATNFRFTRGAFRGSR
jgi:hypothetical protein